MAKEVLTHSKVALNLAKMTLPIKCILLVASKIVHRIKANEMYGRTHSNTRLGHVFTSAALSMSLDKLHDGF